MYMDMNGNFVLCLSCLIALRQKTVHRPSLRSDKLWIKHISKAVGSSIYISPKKNFRQIFCVHSKM